MSRNDGQSKITSIAAPGLLILFPILVLSTLLSGCPGKSAPTTPGNNGGGSNTATNTPLPSGTPGTPTPTGTTTFSPTPTPSHTATNTPTST
ncbi:MAG TPA: hypothetical protein VK859_11950, partial [bacterium]|nr:hypothetical protein [bacterium]